MGRRLAPKEMIPENDFHRALFRRVKAALEDCVFDGVPQDEAAIGRYAIVLLAMTMNGPLRRHFEGAFEAATGKPPSPLDAAGMLYVLMESQEERLRELFEAFEITAPRGMH